MGGYRFNRRSEQVNLSSTASAIDELYALILDLPLTKDKS